VKPVLIDFEHGWGRMGAWLHGHSASSRLRAALTTALLATGAIALTMVTWLSWEAQQRMRATEDAIARLQQKSDTRSRRAAADAAAPLLGDQQRRDWNRVVRQLNTPWSAILDALETSLQESVALVAIEPDAVHGSVRMQVEARTLDAALVYASILGTTEPFDGVDLVKHETNEQDATRPMRLSMDAKLRSSVAARAAAKATPQ
jgi:hypothetical protein